MSTEYLKNEKKNSRNFIYHKHSLIGFNNSSTYCNFVMIKLEYHYQQLSVMSIVKGNPTWKLIIDILICQ